MSRTILLTILAPLLITSSVLAQDYWQHSPAPFGGTVRSMVEADNGDILVGTFEGTFRSSDNGANWSLSQSGMANHYNTDLFKHSNGDIYANGFDRLSGSRLFKSVDNGQNWTEVPNLPLVPATDPTQLVVLNSSGDIFVAGTDVGNFIVSRSTDEGASWTTVLSNGLLNAIGDLDVTSTDDILVGILSGSQGGLHRSTDNGNTWSHTYSDDDVFRIFVDPNDEIYISCGASVQHSTDNGASWNEIYDANSLPEFWDAPYSITVTDLGDIFIGAGNFGAGGEGIGRSTDSGATWSFVNNGLPGYAQQFLFGYPRVHCLFSHSNGTLFAGLDGLSSELSSSGGIGGVYTSVDNGDSWTEAGNGLHATNISIVMSQSSGNLFAVPFVGLMFSGDEGTTWSDRSPEAFGVPLSITALDYGTVSGNIYAGGLLTPAFQSTDRGLTWTDLGLGNIAAAGAVENSSGDIFVSSNLGVHRSMDGGGSWTHVYTGNTAGGIGVAPNGDVFVIGFIPGGLYRSQDNGDTWAQLTSGLSGGVRKFTYTPDNTLFASDTWGIHRSDDNGDSWTQADNGIPTGSLGNTAPLVKSLKANSVGHIFASVEYFDTMDDHRYDVFRTTDNGNNWEGLSTGIVGDYTIVNSISIHDDGIAYLGATNGVYRSMGSTTEVKQLAGTTPTSFRLEQNYPNPFNPSTTISFDLPRSGFVSLTVFDLIGREVAGLVNENLEAGSYSVDFHPEELSSGLYVYRLTAGEFHQVRKMILLR